MQRTSSNPSYLSNSHHMCLKYFFCHQPLFPIGWEDLSIVRQLRKELTVQQRHQQQANSLVLYHWEIIFGM
jgi:hypothetical protein